MQVLAPVSDDPVLKSFDGASRGHLKDAIELRFSRDGLRARIGFITKRVTQVYFYARFLVYGFRHHKAGDPLKAPSGEFIQRDFMRPAFEFHRRGIQQNMRREVNAAFKQVARSRPPDV